MKDTSGVCDAGLVQSPNCDTCRVRTTFSPEQLALQTVWILAVECGLVRTAPGCDMFGLPQPATGCRSDAGQETGDVV